MASLPTPNAHASVFIWVWSIFPITGAGNAILALFNTRFTRSAGDGNSPGGNDFLHFLSFGITGFFQVTVSDIERLLKLYVRITQVICSNFSGLSKSPSMLLIEDSSSRLLVRILAVSW